jgi:hypothetical protein
VPLATERLSNGLFFALPPLRIILFCRYLAFENSLSRRDEAKKIEHEAAERRTDPRMVWIP